MKKEDLKGLELAVSLLSVAKCPECDGSGGIAFVNSEHGCCGNPLDTGECCNNPIQVQVEDYRQCQWCDERNQLMKDTKKCVKT